MLYHLLYPLHVSLPIFNVVRYITFRTASASVTALALSLMLGPMHDPAAARVPDRSGDPAGRAADTPREGRHADHGWPADPRVGAIVPTLLWANLTNAEHLDRRHRHDVVRRRRVSRTTI